MGAFLVIALAIPSAYSSSGVAFALGYLAAVLLHAGMYLRGTSLSEVRAILRIVPFSLVGAALVLIGARPVATHSGSYGRLRRFCSGSRPGSPPSRASSSRPSTSSSGTDS